MPFYIKKLYWYWIMSLTWFSPVSQIVFFEGKCFMGRRLEVFGDSENFQDRGLMNRVNSIRVESGAWVCFDHPDFKGQQYMLEKGEYPDFQRWNAHNDHMGSCKPIKMVRCFLYAMVNYFMHTRECVLCYSTKVIFSLVSFSMESSTGWSSLMVKTSPVSVLKCVKTVLSSRALDSPRTASTPSKSMEMERTFHQTWQQISKSYAFVDPTYQKSTYVTQTSFLAKNQYLSSSLIWNN